MIIEHSGKRIAFGMNWRSRFSEGDVHSDARAAKSNYFWYADKAVYFGTLPENEDKKKQKAPLYAGAVALAHRYPDVPNLAVVLEVPEGHPEYPDGAYIVCGIHQSRPRSGYDKIVTTEVEVSDMLKEFATLCGGVGFELYGDAKISGITPASMDDVHQGAEQSALMRKTKSAMVNPIATGVIAIGLIAVIGYSYNTYSDYKKAETQRIAMAAQKDAQQLYMEELAVRRMDGAVLAQSVSAVLIPLREMAFSLGGWPLTKSTCTLPPEKHMACTFDYVRPEGSKATYETFLAAAKQQFANVEFAGATIKASKTFNAVPFIEHGKVIDTGKSQRDEVIEFGSALQRLERVGVQKRGEFEPFAVPPGVSTGELTSPPVTAATWEITTPLRSMKELAAFPGYATISQLAVTHSTQPMYELKSSLVMVTVTGKIFSKPN